MEKQATNPKFISKLNAYVVALLAFSIPFPRQFSLYLIVLWIVLSVSERIIEKRFSVKKQDWIILTGFFLFYLLHITGLFYSTNTGAAGVDIILRIPFVFMPLLLALSTENLTRYKKKILLAFVAGNIVAALICLGAAVSRSLSYVDGQWQWQAELMEHYGYTFWQMLANGGNNFMYEPLSIFIHPGYFAIYMVTAVVILLDSLADKEAKNTVGTRSWISILIVFCSIMVYLLFSRTGLIALFLVLFFYFILFVFRQKSKLLKGALLMGVALFTIAGVYVFIHNGRMKNTYSQIRKYVNNPSDVSKNDDRIFIWGLSINIIQENLVFGVGTGDSKDELMEKYQEKQMEEAMKARLNVHNQYLETTIQLGMLGLLSLLFIFTSAFYRAAKRHDKKLALVLFVNALFFLFESVLNTQTGVYYFVFVISVLLFVPQGKAGNKITFS